MKLLIELVVLVISYPADARLGIAIAKVEGCWKWHNPGCLLFAKQPAAERGPHGYAKFENNLSGIVGLLKDLGAKRRLGYSDYWILREWNPVGGHDYALMVLEKLEKVDY